MMRKPVPWALSAPLALLGLAAFALAGCSHGGDAPVAAADDGCPRFLGHHACEMERAQHPQAAQAPGPASPTAPASAP
ncbi:MAG: hypothetical protein ACXU8U_06005, partial [Asticcacaulis sp.]